jgi:stage V sporulation protein B
VSQYENTQEDMTDVAEGSIRGGTHLVLGIGISIAITGVGSIVTARLLGPIVFSQYSLVMVLPTLLFSFTIFGIDIALVRYISKLREEYQVVNAIGILKTGLGLRIVIAIIFSVIGFVGADFFSLILIDRPSLAPYVRFVCLAVVFESIYWVSFYAFQAFDKTGSSAMTRILQAVTKAGTSILLIWFGFGLLGAVLGAVLSYILTAILAIIWLFKVIHDSSKSNDSVLATSERAKMLLSYGIPLYAVTLISSIIIQYRLVLLALFSNDVVVGNFKATINVSTILSGLTFALFITLLPAFSKVSTKTSSDNHRRAFIFAHRFVSMLIIPAAVIFIVLSDEIALVLYGADYKYVSLFLVLYSGVFLLIGIGNGILDSFFNGVGENRLTLQLWLIHALIFSPLGFLFTINYGAIGLIVAEIFSRSIACICGLWRGKHKLGIGVDISGLGRTYLSSGFAGVGVILFGFFYISIDLVSLVVGSLVFLIIYTTLLPLTKAMRPTDIELLDNAFKTMRGLYILIKPFLRYVRFVSSLAYRNNEI